MTTQGKMNGNLQSAAGISVTERAQHARVINELNCRKAKLHSIVDKLGGDPTPISAPDAARQNAKILATMEGAKYQANMNYEDHDHGEKEHAERVIEDLQADVQRLRTVAWTLGRGRSDIEQQLRDAGEA